MTIPKTMRAIVLTEHGDMDKLVYHTDWPIPEIGATEVLIKVGACGMNNTDVNTRSGWYSKAVTEATTGDGYDTVEGEEDPSWGGAPITFPRIQGADAVGVVVAQGDNVEGDFIGKRVMNDGWLRNWEKDPASYDVIGYFGSECDGGFAEYTKNDYRNISIVNSDLTDAELATFACSYTTAEGMITKAKVTSSDTVLVTGASGGVGSAVIQLSKRRGAKVIALASKSKHEHLKSLGADVLLDRDPDNLAKALKETTGSDTVSVVADIVAGDTFAKVLDVLERGGRYTSSGAIAGPIVEMDMRTFYLRDLTLTGSTVTPLHIFPDLVSYIEKGEIKPLVAATYSLEDFHAGQTAFIEKKHVGNIVVVP